MSEKIRKFILKYISKKGKLPKDVDIDQFDYIDTGYIDSMAFLRFVVALEQEFDIELTDEDIMRHDFKTVGGLAAVIENKIEAKNG